jgi:hypothetical protein
MKSAYAKINEYLAQHPDATKDEVIKNVFYGYVGNGEQRKTIDRMFRDREVRAAVAVDNFDMLNCVL